MMFGDVQVMSCAWNGVGRLTIVYLLVFVWILLAVGNFNYLPAVDGASVSETANLTCFDCSETFSRHWQPFTPCQRDLTENLSESLPTVNLRLCHPQDKYCKVDRTTVKGMITSISRGCSGECIYGCRAFGYGITQLRCTSCCQGNLCNNDSSASVTSIRAATVLAVAYIAYTID